MRRRSFCCNENTSPHGMAIRFALPGNAYTDSVANSHNGFFVGNGNDFLALLKAIAGTNEKSPPPSPIEQFLGTHPAALKVIVDSKHASKSFQDLDFYGNNAFIFVDAAGGKHPSRYQIIPVADVVKLDSATAAKQKPDYMFDALKAALAMFLQSEEPCQSVRSARCAPTADRGVETAGDG